MSGAGSPLRSLRIGITRPATCELGDRLEALGAVVVHVPLIEIDDPADGGAALRDALARLDTFDWLIVTSANGARRVGIAARAPAVRLAAVGPATADVLAIAAGRPVDLVASISRVEGLLAEFPAPPVRVLLAQADRARDLLADGLSAAGHDVETVTAYRTVMRRLTLGEVEELASTDAIVLASGSAAQAYAESLGARAGLRTSKVVVAIGPATAEAARSYGLTVTHVAASPDADTLVELLESAFPTSA